MSNPGIPEVVQTAQPTPVAPVETPAVAPVPTESPVAAVENPTLVAAVVEPAPVQGPQDATSGGSDPTAVVAETAKTVEPTPAPEKATPDTLLGKPEAKIEPPKAPETQVTPQEAPKNDEGGQTEETAPPPTYEAFTLPENVSLDAERVGKFTELLSKLELDGKADHASVQKFGQEAVDFHIAEVTKAVENYHTMAMTTWEKQKNDWKEQTIKDPEIGGNRLQTTLDAARSFIRLYGGSQEQQEEIRNVMETSGLGNHPVVIRLFANATRDLAEGKPLAGGRPIPAPKSKTQTLYGK